MTLELWFSIASLALSTFSGILTIIITWKIGKLNNLEALHKYEKKITKFELSFKDEEWLLAIMKTGEFSNYNEESKQLIHQWWLEYKKEHKPKKAKSTLPKSKNFSGVKYKLAPTPQSGTGKRQRPQTPRVIIKG